jgi:putative oxidoreductase
MFKTMSQNLLVPLILRLGLAVLFLYSGYIKIVGPSSKTVSDTQWGANWLPNEPEIVRPLAPPIQVAVAWSELLGGLLLALGLLTRVAALGIALIMAGTIYWYTGAQGLKGGYDYNLAVIVMCLALIISGGGTLAVDRLIRIKRRMFT